MMTSTLSPAHPLFPVHQAFLWLPGLPGDQTPFCSYNERPDPADSRAASWTGAEIRRDANLAPYSPPFPVSSETYIAWQTNVSPPFPFHPIPVVSSLSPRQMEDLAQRVMKQQNLSADSTRSPLHSLRNDSKCAVLTALTEMGLLSKTLTPYR